MQSSPHARLFSSRLFEKRHCCKHTFENCGYQQVAGRIPSSPDPYPHGGKKANLSRDANFGSHRPSQTQTLISLEQPQLLRHSDSVTSRDTQDMESEQK